MAASNGMRMWELAVRRAVCRPVSFTDKRKKLEQIADKLVELAAEGDMAAIAEVGNRLDGKAKQSLELEVNNRMTIVIGQSGHGETVGTVQVQDVTADGTVLSRGIDTKTTEPELLPALAYETTKPLRKQHVSSAGQDNVDMASTYGTEEGRIARVRAMLALRSADTVPVDGVLEPGVAVPGPYHCVHAASGQHPCAVCTRVPSCPRRSVEDGAAEGP